MKGSSNILNKRHTRTCTTKFVRIEKENGDSIVIKIVLQVYDD